jgi:bacterioferritin-associated ferredoxin
LHLRARPGICARVRECEVRTAILGGARCEESVGVACGAGTGCGSCVDRICDLIDEVGDASVATMPALALSKPDTLAVAAA